MKTTFVPLLPRIQDRIQFSRDYMDTFHSAMLWFAPGDEYLDYRLNQMSQLLNAHINEFADELVRRNEAEEWARETMRIYDELGVFVGGFGTHHLPTPFPFVTHKIDPDVIVWHRCAQCSYLPILQPGT
jgi:hypothetical protein